MGEKGGRGWIQLISAFWLASESAWKTGWLAAVELYEQLVLKKKTPQIG